MVRTDLLKLSRDIRKEVDKGINLGLSVRNSIRRAWRKLGVQIKLTDIILNGIIFSVNQSLSSPIIPDKIPDFKDWKLNSTIRRGVTLSDQIYKTGLETRELIADAYETALSNGKAWTSVAREVGNTGLVKGDIRGSFKELENATRKAVTPEDFKKLSGDIRKTRREIEKLTERDITGGRLKKSYKNLLDKIESGSEEAIAKAYDRAVKAKINYNTMRLVRTENARAYGEGIKTEVADDPDVEAVRWELSSAHAIFDICDFHADVDLHNLGQGVYPKDSVPAYPAHPHCMCNLFPVYRVKKGGRTKASNTKAAEWINKQPENKKTQLVGKNTVNKKNWNDKLRNYSGQENLKTIPKEFYLTD